MAAQIGEAAPLIEPSRRDILDVGVQAHSPAAPISCDPERGVHEEPGHAHSEMVRHDAERVDDQHLVLLRLDRPSRLLVRVRCVVIEHHNAGDGVVGDGQVQLTRFNPPGDLRRRRVVLRVPVGVVHGLGEVVDDPPVGRLRRRGVVRLGSSETQLSGASPSVGGERVALGCGWVHGGVAGSGSPRLTLERERP